MIRNDSGKARKIISNTEITTEEKRGEKKRKTPVMTDRKLLKRMTESEGSRRDKKRT